MNLKNVLHVLQKLPLEHGCFQSTSLLNPKTIDLLPLLTPLNCRQPYPVTAFLTLAVPNSQGLRVEAPTAVNRQWSPV